MGDRVSLAGTLPVPFAAETNILGCMNVVDGIILPVSHGRAVSKVILSFGFSVPSPRVQ
jgi:hypothetical protein